MSIQSFLYCYMCMPVMILASRGACKHDRLTGKRRLQFQKQPGQRPDWANRKLAENVLVQRVLPFQNSEWTLRKPKPSENSNQKQRCIHATTCYMESTVVTSSIARFTPLPSSTVSCFCHRRWLPMYHLTCWKINLEPA